MGFFVFGFWFSLLLVGHIQDTQMEADGAGGGAGVEGTEQAGGRDPSDGARDCGEGLGGHVAAAGW